MIRTAIAAWMLGAVAAPLAAQTYDERPATLVQPAVAANYERRTVDIPMRDGVKLHTIILLPRGARGAPMLLTRTPYDATKMTAQVASGDLAATLQGYDNATDVIVDGGYIRVIQDVRGKYGSGGGYVMNRPFVGSGLNPTKVDHATDTYDTIEWLVRHVPESNGRVGIIGISYDGFTTLAALVHPHPALKAAVPMNPMVDGWRGDDWFHNGAFRQMGIDYIWEQIATRDNTSPWIAEGADQYDMYMRAGSAGALARAHGLDQIGFWQKIKAHPAYDSFWQAQAMDRVLAAEPLKVPVMIVHSLWDQEDIYGAPAVYAALEPKDTANDKVYLTMGPWYHGQGIDDGSRLGALKFGQDTAYWWRHEVLAPFLAHFLKDAPMEVAPVTAFETGTNRWQKLTAWEAPAATKLYLAPSDALSGTPVQGTATADYLSDPAHPVTFVARPVKAIGYDGNPWPAWLAGDQRIVSSRPDVLTFTGPVLTAPVKIAGAPVVHLTAATSGSDADWVVKLIDVYPDSVAGQPEMAGYQLAVGMDVFRARYREGLDKGRPVQPNAALGYTFALPQANHVFLPGHRMMVQVQSSWFPLYDRNPQTFVPSIFDARPEDYVKATQRVSVAGPQQSYIALPVVR